MTFGGPFNFLDSDLTRHLGYRLLEGYGLVPYKPRPGEHRVPQLELQVLDANLRVVRHSSTCSILSHFCEASGVDWPSSGRQWYVRDSGKGPATIRADSNSTADFAGGPSNVWRTTVAEYDSLPAPRRITYITRYQGQTTEVTEERRSYVADGPMATIGLWPPAHVGGTGKWANALFPGADRDVLDVGVSPLSAFTRLEELRPDVAAKLALGGCVVGFQAETLGPAAGSNRDTDMTFIVQDNAGATTAPGVRWHERAAGLWALDPHTLDSASPPSKRACSQQEASPWPAASVADLVEAWRSWDARGDIRLTVGLDAIGTGNGSCCHGPAGTLPVAYLGGSTLVGFDLQGAGYTFVQSVANVTYDSVGNP
ncbi:MAG: hypothetical protein ACYDBQ_02695 [Thermoplasmatota archaeon]